MAQRYKKTASSALISKELQRQSGPGRPLKSTSEMLNEYGTAGSKLINGILYDEYIPELSFYNAPQTYDRMWRSDGTIAALIAAYVMPLRAAKWYIQPYDDSPDSLRMADFLHDNLWNFGTQTFDDFFQEAMSCIPFGFSWFEKIFDWIQTGEFVGKLGWHHFAFRHQATRYRYNTAMTTSAGGAHHRRLVSITQYAPPDYQEVDIPIEKCLLFSINKLGDIYDGRSVLRYAWTHYKIKQILYKIQGIGLERASMGVPYAGYLQQASDKTINYITQMLENLRVDDQASVQFDKNVVDIGFLQNHFDASALRDAIDHHDTKIMQSGLAQFVNLGTRSAGATGSYALSQNQSEMFLDALNGEGNTFASNFHMQGTQQLLRLNFGDTIPGYQMPMLAHGDIGQRAAIQLAQALNAFAQYGFLTPDPTTENTLRELLDLPERDEDFHEAMAEAALMQGPASSGDRAVNNAAPGTQKAGAVPGAPGAAGSGAGVSGNGNGQKTGFRNRGVSGAPTGTKQSGGLAAAEYDKMFTIYMSEMESLKKTATSWTPTRPSIRAAQTRRPYVLRGD